MLRSSLARALACGALLTGVAAAPAGADSIAYIKGGDVWLATPDGSRQVQITHTGKYGYVSQADDGTMIALAPGERLHRLSRTGKVLADFPTFVSDGAPQSGPVNKFYGPFNPEISPDGKLVAFEWFNKSYEDGGQPDCSATSSPPCYVLTSSQGVGITRSDGFTGFEEYGLLTGWIGPQWLSNDKLLRSFANSTMTEDTVFNDIGPGKGDSALDRWFYDETGGLLYEAELSRDRRVAAGIGGWNDEQLRVYRPLVEPFGAKDPNMQPFAPKNDPLVEACFTLGNPVGGKFESLSVSPDGRGLAYGVGDGIWVAEVPDLAGGCANPASNALKIPGGRFPHWGPADVPAIGGGGGGGHAALAVKVTKSTRRAALRRGLPVTVTAPGAGKVAVTVKAGGRQAGRATKTVAAAGKAKLTVRLKGAARRAARLVVAVTFKPQGGGAALRRTAAVTVKR